MRLWDMQKEKEFTYRRASKSLRIKLAKWADILHKYVQLLGTIPSKIVEPNEFRQKNYQENCTALKSCAKSN